MVGGTYYELLGLSRSEYLGTLNLLYTTVNNPHGIYSMQVSRLEGV